jgi:hypothetical protein
MRKELLKMKYQVNNLKRDLHSGEFCSECMVKVVTRLGIEEAAPAPVETRVTSSGRESTGASTKGSSINNNEKPSRKRSNAGAIHLGSGLHGLNKRTAPFLGALCLVAVLGFMGFTTYDH